MKHAQTPEEVYWLLINWWIKMAAGILYAWMIVYYYGYGDPIGYKARTDEVLTSIGKNWENIKYLFLPLQSFKDYILSHGYTNQRFLTFDFGFYAENNFMISRVSGVLAFFTFNRFLLLSFIFTNIAYYGFVMLYTASKKIISGYDKELAIACLFIPSCIFWSSGLAKEPLCIISLGAIFNSSIELFFKKRIRMITIFSLVFFSFMLIVVKNYIFYCFLGALIFWLAYNRVSRLSARSVLIKPYLYTFFIAGAVTIAYYVGGVAFFKSLITNNLAEIISYNVGIYGSMSSVTEGGGSLIDVSNMDLTSLPGILKYIPQGMINVFFRPFPWEISNALMIFAALENLFFTVLFFKVLVKSRFFRRGLEINKNYHVFAIAISISLAFLIAISTFNFGSMARYKMPLLPFWAAFLLIINKKLTRKKELLNG